MTIKGNRKSCKCEECKGACEDRIGWFKFGEVEKLAKNMKLSLQELFDKYLMIDFWESGSTIFVLAPAKVGYKGRMISYDPRGKCALLKKGLCIIHDKGKPFECRKALCTDLHDKVDERHKMVAETWNNKKAQKQIEKLLGKKLVCPENDNSLSLFGSLFSY